MTRVRIYNTTSAARVQMSFPSISNIIGIMPCVPNQSLLCVQPNRLSHVSLSGEQLARDGSSFCHFAPSRNKVYPSYQYWRRIGVGVLELDSDGLLQRYVDLRLISPKSNCWQIGVGSVRSGGGGGGNYFRSDQDRFELLPASLGGRPTAIVGVPTNKNAIVAFEGESASGQPQLMKLDVMSLLGGWEPCSRKCDRYAKFEHRPIRSPPGTRVSSMRLGPSCMPLIHLCRSDGVLDCREYASMDSVLRLEHPSPVTCSFADDSGYVVVTGQETGRVTKWDLRMVSSSGTIGICSDVFHEGRVNDIVGIGKRRVATCGEDGVVRWGKLHYEGSSHRVTSQVIIRPRKKYSAFSMLSMRMKTKEQSISLDTALVLPRMEELVFQAQRRSSHPETRIGKESDAIRVVNDCGFELSARMTNLCCRSEFFSRVLEEKSELYESWIRDGSVSVGDISDDSLRVLMNVWHRKESEIGSDTPISVLAEVWAWLDENESHTKGYATTIRNLIFERMKTLSKLEYWLAVLSVGRFLLDPTFYRTFVPFWTANAEYAEIVRRSVELSRREWAKSLARDRLGYVADLIDEKLAEARAKLQDETPQTPSFQASQFDSSASLVPLDSAVFDAEEGRFALDAEEPISDGEEVVYEFVEADDDWNEDDLSDGEEVVYIAQEGDLEEEGEVSEGEEE